MFISVRELALKPLDFDEELAPGKLDLGPDMKQVERLTTSGRAQLISEHRGPRQVLNDLRITGNLNTTVELQCARCLTPVRQAIEHEFELLYRPLGADKGREETPVKEAESDISYYEGDGLQLEDVLREQVMLAVPMRVLCDEGCKGLCLHCGRNRNTGECQCAAAATDPRWNALKGLKK
jgi:uncharacterized protein